LLSTHACVTLRAAHLVQDRASRLCAHAGDRTTATGK
jgi:hypothetical protein